jgi:hypothetical protein
MRPDDDLEAARDDAAQFAGTPQFWDGQLKLGKEVAVSVGAPDWTAWDVYLLYPAGAHTTDGHLPPPSGALAQMHGVVVATKGLLPAVPDQSALPADIANKVDVVGSQDDLEELLARAVP